MYTSMSMDVCLHQLHIKTMSLAWIHHFSFYGWWDDIVFRVLGLMCAWKIGVIDCEIDPSCDPGAIPKINMIKVYGVTSVNQWLPQGCNELFVFYKSSRAYWILAKALLCRSDDYWQCRLLDNFLCRYHSIMLVNSLYQTSRRQRWTLIISMEVSQTV